MKKSCVFLSIIINTLLIAPYIFAGTTLRGKDMALKFCENKSSLRICIALNAHKNDTDIASINNITTSFCPGMDDILQCVKNKIAQSNTP